jgi:hypothetical protein
MARALPMTPTIFLALRIMPSSREQAIDIIGIKVGNRINGEVGHSAFDVRPFLLNHARGGALHETPLLTFPQNSHRHLLDVAWEGGALYPKNHLASCSLSAPRFHTHRVETKLHSL